MTAPAPERAPSGDPPAPFARTAPLVAWLAGRAALDADAEVAAAATDPAATAAGAADPDRLARALVAAGRPADALRVVACALPPRESVWWAWAAARHAHDATAGGAAERGALAAAERWIVRPTDEHRRAAWAAGQAAGLETPAGAVAAAAFFATGSLAPAGSPVAVPPPPGAYAVLAAGAVLLAAARTDPVRLAELVAAFVAQGADVAGRVGGWEAAATAARDHYLAQAGQHGRAAAAAAPATAPPDATLESGPTSGLAG